jgi:ABC-type Fe3+-hydroxamate transport system substrate-binding protein
MSTYADQLGRFILLPEPPRRVVSVVPSQTELLYDLGLDEIVCGITRFCIHPKEWFKSKTKVGGTKQLHLERIASLQPDLIIANKEENNREQIEWLASRFPVWISDVHNLKTATEMIEQVGALCRVGESAKNLAGRIQEKFWAAEAVFDDSLTAVYLIWNNPLMAAGSSTFIDDMMKRAGYRNLITESRYPEISAEMLKELQPEVLLLSSEPYPFGEKHIAFFQQLLPSAEVLLVDGEMFSWYGSRMLHAPEYFTKLRRVNQ